ncbi:uncharacterized protein LOC115454010 [Manduca sexta]|uniref:uncharacterized protein LOC115454010 n=1 Tax=Manduca sexta TaxID=7130 RepID=UPI00188F7675|nr:uncharacterized protein LOC115454010 [Manduca sexta]
MNLNNLYLGLFLFSLTLVGLRANKMCYKSKTCIHNGLEKCGVNSENKPRRFLDSCDIMEYNCLKGTDFQKTSLEKCASLPPLDYSQESNKASASKQDNDETDDDKASHSE